MNEETLNLSIRKFLKLVGVNSQRELEHAVSQAIASGSIAGNEALNITMTLEVTALNLKTSFDGQILLQ
ncbi:MAG TPA: DUF6494 family protein [Burkholderiaceae bacterium]|jgi:hypothetical protein|nr:DUF6494 family protein [Burkholderiaceae bacterium]